MSFSVPTLAQTLADVNGAYLARSIGATRTHVHRLKRGAPLHDDMLIVPIADAIGMDLATFVLVVERDLAQRR